MTRLINVDNHHISITPANGTVWDDNGGKIYCRALIHREMALVINIASTSIVAYKGS